MIVLSKDPVAKYLELGEKSTDFIRSVCCSNLNNFYPDVTYQIIAVLS